jgi:WD40 repeat protein
VDGDDRLLKLWDIRISRLLASIHCGVGFPFAHVAVSPSGRLLATGAAEGSGVNVRALASDPAHGRPRWNLHRHLKASGPSAFSPDGKGLAVANWFGVALWTLDSDTVQRFEPELKEICQVVGISPDGHTLRARALYARRNLPVRRAADSGVEFVLPRVEVHKVVSLELSCAARRM